MFNEPNTCTYQEQWLFCSCTLSVWAIRTSCLMFTFPRSDCPSRLYWRLDNWFLFWDVTYLQCYRVMNCVWLVPHLLQYSTISVRSNALLHQPFTSKGVEHTDSFLMYTRSWTWIRSFLYRDNSVHLHECTLFLVGMFIAFNKETIRFTVLFRDVHSDCKSISICYRKV